jgi:hypothetical protein
MFWSYLKVVTAIDSFDPNAYSVRHALGCTLEHTANRVSPSTRIINADNAFTRNSFSLPVDPGQMVRALPFMNPVTDHSEDSQIRRASAICLSTREPTRFPRAFRSLHAPGYYIARVIESTN